VQAFEIRFIIYDAFGSYLTTLSGTRIADLAANSTYLFADANTMHWLTTEADVSQYLTCIAFVAQARLQGGQIWHYDPKLIEEKIVRLNLKPVMEPPARPTPNPGQAKI
jgi:hypothetical protein